MSPLDTSRLRAEVVRYAHANLGYGETEGNNRGRFIRALGGVDGQEWCAIFAGYCYRKAYQSLKMPMPDWLFRRRNVPEPGAKRLTRGLGRVGSIWRPDECDGNRPRPGDLVCWSRGLLGWQGHVGIVTEVDHSYVWYTSGNEGRDGTVKSRIVDPSNPKLWRFASIER